MALAPALIERVDDVLARLEAADRALSQPLARQLELARRGVSREQAYEWVQRNAMRAYHEKRNFKALLLEDADVTRALPPPEIERAFDLDEQLRHVDRILDRVFSSSPELAGVSRPAEVSS